MGIHRDISRRARVQHGLIRRDQLQAIGVPERTIGEWIETSRLERVHPRVYRLPGTPHTWHQSVLAAAFASGGVVSHASAARLWGVHDTDDVEVTVPVTQRPRLVGAVVHRSGDLAPRFVTTRQGIPVTNPMRTLVDLGAVVKRPHVSDALERAVTARVCSVLAVERAMDQVARKGRSGVGVIREILDDRALGTARADGLLEARMARLLRDHGLPRPLFQHQVRHHGRFVARVDFAYPDVRLALEVDGFEVHGSPQALQADLERQNRLVAAGWTVLRFTWTDVVRRPEWVAAQVMGMLSRAA